MNLSEDLINKKIEELKKIRQQKEITESVPSTEQNSVQSLIKENERLEKALKDEQQKHHLSKCNIKNERLKKEKLMKENTELKIQHELLMAELQNVREENNKLKKELQKLKKKKIHKKIITFSPLSDSEIQKISQE